MGSKVDSNDGARQLRECGASLAEIAKAAKSSREAARKWRDGITVPGPEFRPRLAKAFGIGVNSWDLAPGVAPARSSDPPPERQRPARRGPPPATGPEPSGDTEADMALALDGPDAARDAAAAHLRRVTRLREEIQAKGGSVLDIGRALDLERKAILDFGRFNGELTPADEARLTQTPRFKAIVQAVSKALVRYPDAARAVASTLREIDA